MGQSMNNCERVEMLRLMAEELNDSISTYEGAKKGPKDATQAYGGVTASNTAAAIKRKIVHMRQVLLDLGERL